MSNNSILAAKYLQKIMEGGEELMSVIKKENILPLYPTEIKFPFVYFCRTGLSTEYNKSPNGVYVDKLQFTFIVASDKYEESLMVANALRHTLERYQYVDEDITIGPISMTEATEYVSEDAYCQELVFEFISY